jgi:two-component system KDP operon response regulator KdpE
VIAGNEGVGGSVPGITALVVDDDPALRRVLRRVFERDAATVVEAADAAEALSALARLRPDLVILDVPLPGAGGYKVLSRIRERSDVPVLMLATDRDEIAKVVAAGAGCDDFVTKPFGLQDILARAHALLRRGRAGAHVVN